MQKEKITLAAVRNDLLRASRIRLGTLLEWRWSSIFSFTIVAALVGLVLWALRIGLWPLGVLLVLSGAVYHAVRLVFESREQKRETAMIEAAIERGDFAVTREILSHTATEVVYEPHVNSRGRNRSMREVLFFYFQAGGRWRVPRLEKHYTWSRELSLGTTGLWQTAVSGNEYYRVTLQGHPDIAYIYPLKFFTLSAELAGSAQDGARE
jgi:hypothetical protein